MRFRLAYVLLLVIIFGATIAMVIYIVWDDLRVAQVVVTGLIIGLVLAIPVCQGWDWLHESSQQRSEKRRGFEVMPSKPDRDA